MIHLFAGNDAHNKHASYERFVEGIPEARERFFISRNDFNQSQIESLYSGSGLFFNKCVVIFSGVLEREETRDFILDKLDLIGQSDNTFIFLEGKLLKPILDAFKQVRAELNIFELPKEKMEKFDNFLVANAFARKDKLNLWIYFCQAVDLGVGLEELTGVLFWKAKDLILKKNFDKFSEEELKNFTAQIAYLLPEARARGRDAETTLEKFLLEAF